METHEEYAARILGKSVEEVTPEERRIAKELRFGEMYGAKGLPPRIATTNFSIQQEAAFFQQEERIAALLAQGMEIMPGSTFTDAMFTQKEVRDE